MMNNQQGFQMYQGIEDMLSLSTGAAAAAAAAAAASCTVDAPPSHSLFYNVSALREKIQQLESYVGIIISPSGMQQDSVVVAAVSSAGSLAQEIIVAASSTMYALHQIGLEVVPPPTDELLARHAKTSYEGSNEVLDHVVRSNNLDGSRSIVFGNADIHYNGNPSNTTSDHVTSGTNGESAVNSSKSQSKLEFARTAEKKKEPKLDSSSKECDIIELNAADLLAKYTHYCQVCGKGFKRDANLRMHMRAHGDEYKTTAALTNPARTMAATLSGEKEGGACGSGARKYSCPQEGCRWNKKHPRFTPLKSLVCIKNHYKRSHCPKMYVCKRCGQKQFSVLSDLRTHEKHCGDLRWRCSCGTNFSRKDKLMGHVALFVGHSPIISGASCTFTKN